MQKNLCVAGAPPRTPLGERRIVGETPPHSLPPRRLRRLDSRRLRRLISSPPRILILNRGYTTPMNVCTWGPAKYFGLGPLEALIRPWLGLFNEADTHDFSDMPCYVYCFALF